jgi:hypothetical protein
MWSSAEPWEGRRNAKEGPQLGTDPACVAPGGEWHQGERHLPRGRRELATFYLWKKKYSRLALNKLLELRHLRPFVEPVRLCPRLRKSLVGPARPAST